jgi:hypothetical protein
MKTIALIMASIAVGATAVAQQTTVRGNGAAESQTSVSADRRGANDANDSSAHAGIAAERGAGQGGAASAAGASEMNATLERSVDARRAKPGDEVTAKTSETFTTESGMTIPRGTRLVGRVTEARPHERGEGSTQGASQLGIVFNKAVMKDGSEVPMQATIQALAAAQSHAAGGVGSASRDAGAFGASRAAGGASGGLGGAIGGLGGAGAAGGAAGNAGAVVGNATRVPRPNVGAVASGAASAVAQGGAALGSSAGAVGGLNAGGQWLAGSRGVFGLRDLSIASSAAGTAHGSLITSASRNVRLDGGTQLLLVGSADVARR